MSLTKKDPSLRVAANDPHLVSLGGGRLSTAVTIHYIYIGDTTIGSSPSCSISLNGSGVRSVHCTIYRSEENEVTIVPETDARILIDGNKITQETNLTQGAMITIGNSNYLRFNNPAEAQMMRSAMGSSERISMPPIDFTQVPKRNSARSNCSSNADNSDIRQSMDIESFFETKINPANNCQITREITKTTAMSLKGYQALEPIDINGLHCPKVFTADLVTVNMPAKDVLGQKYANFAKNLAENHHKDKNISHVLRNNQANNLKTAPAGGTGNYVNIPSTSSYIQNNSSGCHQTASSGGSNEYLTKVNNTAMKSHHNNTGSPLHHSNISAYDRYPKPGTYGGLQIFPMNGVNTEINSCSGINSPLSSRKVYMTDATAANTGNNCQIKEIEPLDDMLNLLTEYVDRQNHSYAQNQSSNSSITSSPIVQNRIKTNGSLPRDKKSPFLQDVKATGSSSNLNMVSSCSSSTGYENVRLNSQNRVEIGSPKSSGGSANGYENVVLGKYIPQSPRTKIRTNCLSPKKEHSFGNTFGQVPKAVAKQNEYEELVKTFEEKFKLEMQAIQDRSRYQPTNSVASNTLTTPKRTNKNINNLSLNLKQCSSLQNSPRLSKKPAPAPRPSLSKTGTGSAGNLQQSVAAEIKMTPQSSSENLQMLKKSRKELQTRIQSLKNEINELQKQENEVIRELDLEKALVSAELSSVCGLVIEMKEALKTLQHKIHRLEAQRNATRVMEENQQAKLKQSIEMKQDQVKKLKGMLKQKPNNACLQEELNSVTDSLENDRKTFEDLEFQYLEEESEWHAYHEELHADEKDLSIKIEEKQLEMQHLEKQEVQDSTVSTDAKTLSSNLQKLFGQLKQSQQQLKSLEANICEITGQTPFDYRSSASDEDDEILVRNLAKVGVMSQSLFGSAEILCPKYCNKDDMMSKSVNENMFYNNNIELSRRTQPSVLTSTPKRAQLQLVEINDMAAENSPNTIERMKFNLSLGSDDFEVNPLEKRVPSQDDIDRICKVTLDAPISGGSASTKIFDSIKEIERNRQLLLAQQGHHVIEHERQKMQDLKKKSHDEAKAQYLSQISSSIDGSQQDSLSPTSPHSPLELETLTQQKHNSPTNANKENLQKVNFNATTASEETTKFTQNSSKEQRHSQSDAISDKHRRSSPRPLSESNSEISCDLLSASSEHNNACKSSIELSSATNTSGIGSRYSAEQNTSGDDSATKRSSVNSNDTASGRSSNTAQCSSPGLTERKRALPKHQRPLTRYLPIFSPDLNLRQHIESAGHQIALCPHVFVDAYSCRGYLHKLGATFHGWARRWFVLDRQKSAFIYYADKSERKPRGGAYFSTIDEVYLDHLNTSKSGRPHCTFIVKTKKRSYHLQAASDAAARIWIDAIITGAQGNLDY